MKNLEKVLVALMMAFLIMSATGCEVFEEDERHEEEMDEHMDEMMSEDEVNQAEENSVEAKADVEVGEEFAEKDREYYMTCDNNKHKFRISENFSDGHGQFSFTGELMIVEDYTPFMEGETSMYVRMKVRESDVDEAYIYYMDQANMGNSINRNEDETLIFNIGIITNGELESTAKIAEDLKAEILTAAENNEEMSLDLTVPVYPGMGAPADFTFACEIE